MNSKLLQQYSDAWNDHDIDRIMKFMTEDCVFESGGGAQKYGSRYQGQEAVRERFIEVWAEIPDVQFSNAVHFTQGRYGCSEWTISGTTKAGDSLEVDDCDLFSFEGGKIKSKRSYLKHRA